MICWTDRSLALYKRAQIICVSSTYEGFSLVLTEALQYGVIPVAFDSFESVHDIIDTGKNGFLVKPFQINYYANILKSLMFNDNLRQQIQMNIQTDTSFSIASISTILPMNGMIYYHALLKSSRRYNYQILFIIITILQ